MSPKIHITLEGNIGAGKSTILSKLYEHFGIDRGINYAWEPLEEWDANCFLEGMYSGKIANAEFQSMILSSMFYETFNGLSSSEILLQERSMDAAFEVFTKANITSPTSFNLIKYSYNKFKLLLKNAYSINTYRIYLRLPPHISFSRISKRSRTYETSVSQDYLNNINNAYEEWLCFAETKTEATKIIYIDASRDINDVTKDVIQAITTILKNNLSPKQLFASKK